MRFSELPEAWQKALGGKGEVAVWLEFAIGDQVTDRVSDVSGISEGYSVGSDWNRRLSFAEAVVALYRDPELMPDYAGGMLHEARGKTIEAISAGATSVKILAESIAFAVGETLTLSGGGNSETVIVASFTVGTLYHTVGFTAGTTNAYPINSEISTPALLGAEATLRLRAVGENSWISLYRGVIVARPEVASSRVYVRLGGRWETAFRGRARMLTEGEKFFTIGGRGQKISSVKVTGATGELDADLVTQKTGGRHGSWRVDFLSASEYKIAGPSTAIRGERYFLPRPAQAWSTTGRTGARHVAYYQGYAYIVENTSSTYGQFSVFRVNSDGSLTWIRNVSGNGLEYDDLFCCYVADDKLYVVQHYCIEWPSGLVVRYSLADPGTPTYESRDFAMPLDEFYGGCVIYGGHVMILHTSRQDFLFNLNTREYGPIDDGMQGMIRRSGTHIYVGHGAYIRIRSWTWPCDLVRSISVTGGTWDWAFAGNIGFCTSPGSHRVLAVDLSDPAGATIIGETSEGLSYPRGLAVLGSFLLVASSNNNKVNMYDISDPETLPLVASYDMAGTPYDVCTAGNCAVAVSLGGGVMTFALIGGTEFEDETLVISPLSFKGNWANGASVEFVTSRVWENQNLAEILRDVVTAAGINIELLDVSSWWGTLELGTLAVSAGIGETEISISVGRWWRLPKDDALIIGSEEVTIATDCFSLPPTLKVKVSALTGTHNVGEVVKWKQRTDPWTSASWDRAYQYAEGSRLKASFSLEEEKTFDDIIAFILQHGNMAMAEDGFGVMRLWPWGPASVDAEEIAKTGIATMTEDAEAVPVINTWRATWAFAEGANQYETENTASPGPEEATVDFGAFYSELPVSGELARRAEIFRGTRVKRANCTFAYCCLAPGDFVTGEIEGIVTSVLLMPRAGTVGVDVWELPDVDLYAYAGQAGAGYRRGW